jgi:aminoglycoside phosphotransferase family enzyme/predicted kinase
MASQPDLVRDLLAPGAYAAASSQDVSLRTTHASWVFLTDADAWKVKRPVDLGFLDFRTVEARRRACEDEVRLNRRLAPGIYLGVEPVRSTEDGLSFQGPGPVVDWAVHMRRLPDSASAAAMLGRGLLGAEALSALAKRLATFLDQARSTPELGAPQVLRGNVDENFAQAEPFVGDLVDRATFEDVRAFQLGALATRADRFVARVREGRIRDGHGDLRLEHVYFLPEPDGIVAIDCIEFNDRFRCGDAAGEAAFLAMELEAARRPDLAAGFLARFAEESDDFGLYGVVDFYLSYRAWVRGKVAAFLASDANGEPASRARKRDEAARLFALARALSGAPIDAPFVVAVGGIVGSGKSTLATALGQELAAPVVSSDRTRKALAGLAATERGDRHLYTPEAIDRTYGEVIDRARRVLESGRGVILDATFLERRRRAAAAELARRAGARFAFLEACCADRAVLRARLAGRRGQPSASDATDAELVEIERRAEPFGADEAGPHVSIDTGGEPGRALASALRALCEGGIDPAAARRA